MNKKQNIKARKIMLERIIKDRYVSNDYSTNFFPTVWLMISTSLFLYSFLFTNTFGFIGGLFFFILAFVFNETPHGDKR